MDKTLAIVIIMLAAITASALLTLFTARAKARQRETALSDRMGREADSAARLLEENEQLRGQVARQEERLRVLERIATDPARRVAREIEDLRID